MDSNSDTKSERFDTNDNQRIETIRGTILCIRSEIME